MSQVSAVESFLVELIPGAESVTEGLKAALSLVSTMVHLVVPCCDSAS